MSTSIRGRVLVRRESVALPGNGTQPTVLKPGRQLPLSLREGRWNGRTGLGNSLRVKKSCAILRKAFRCLPRRTALPFPINGECLMELRRGVVRQSPLTRAGEECTDEESQALLVGDS
jgi:hypothetical protein